MATLPGSRDRQGASHQVFQTRLRGGQFTITDIDGDERFEVVSRIQMPAKRGAEVDGHASKKAKAPSLTAASAADVQGLERRPRCGLEGLPALSGQCADLARGEASAATSAAPCSSSVGESSAAPRRTQASGGSGGAGRAKPPGACAVGVAGLERRGLVRERLREAFGGDGLAERLSERAEAALFQALRLGPQYNRQVRSLIFNLRGDAGLEFRGALRAGAVPVEALASLRAEDMASSAKRAEREQLRREAMEACEADWELRHDTVPLNGTFTCGKCGGNRTWYFQFQTRACDEPMEFFVMCRDCHHGWRHNDVSPDDIFRQVWS